MNPNFFFKVTTLKEKIYKEKGEEYAVANQKLIYAGLFKFRLFAELHKIDPS